MGTRVRPEMPDRRGPIADAEERSSPGGGTPPPEPPTRALPASFGDLWEGEFEEAAEAARPAAAVPVVVAPAARELWEGFLEEQDDFHVPREPLLPVDPQETTAPVGGPVSAGVSPTRPSGESAWPGTAVPRPDLVADEEPYFALPGEVEVPAAERTPLPMFVDFPEEAPEAKAAPEPAPEPAPAPAPVSARSPWAWLLPVWGVVFFLIGVFFGVYAVPLLRG